FSVLTRAVDELGLEWSPPEESSRSHLDEWFLPGHHQAPCQRASLFFPEVLLGVPAFFVFLCPHFIYEKLPPLDKSVVTHLCPPTAIGWKAKASHPSKPCRTTSALTEIKEADKIPFLDAPVSPTGL
ncbi:hypothetical protein M9458_002619, partial [Cirrhinus mrigala]